MGVALTLTRQVCRSAAIAFIAVEITGCAARAASPHWNDKATLDEARASSIVGGFSAEDGRLYHQGLQHLVNAHEKIGGFTIRQVVDQEKAREGERARMRHQIAVEKSAREEQARKRREQALYEAAHHDYCADALKYEKIAASNGVSHSSAYGASIKGLAANERCDNETEQLVNKGYLLSMKAFAEHYLRDGDSRTDFNQANALLVECQTRPGLYGTRTGAGCETQEQYNIRAQTNWEIEENE